MKPGIAKVAYIFIIIYDKTVKSRITIITSRLDNSYYTVALFQTLSFKMVLPVRNKAEL